MFKHHFFVQKTMIRLRALQERLCTLCRARRRKTRRNSRRSRTPRRGRRKRGSRLNVIANQQLGSTPVQARGILPRPEEQKRTCVCQNGSVERINLNFQGCGIVATPMHAPSRTPLLLPLLLSHNLPTPRVHESVMGRLIHTGLGSSSLIAHFLHSPSSLQTRAHLPAPSSLNLQHPDPIFPSLHDPSTPNVTP